MTPSIPLEPQMSPLPLRVQTTMGWLKRLHKAPAVKMTKTEREAYLLEFERARAQAIAGDETAFRGLTDVRWCAECLVSGAGLPGSTQANAPYGRRRKYSNPLFLTPSGLINTYPESDEDLFISEGKAREALAKAGANGAWELRETLLEMELRDKRYLRWEQEVKGTDYQEPKRSLEEVTEIYMAGGRAALRKLYTREHVAKLIGKMRAAGVPDTAPQDWHGSTMPLDAASS